MKTKKNAGGYERLQIGTNIRKWRNVKGIKQKELSSAMRLSEAAISNIENNLTDITLSQIEDIAITLEIEVEELFSDPEERLQTKIIETNNEKSNEQIMEKEIIYALLGSLRKKDEQLDEVIQNIKGQRLFNSNYDA